MNEQIEHTLEFDKVITHLNNQAATTVGKELTQKLKPSTDIKEVRTRQVETDEAGQVIRLNMAIPFGGVADIRASVKRSVIGGILKAEDCLDVSTTLYAARQVKHFFDTLEMELPHLKDKADRIMSLPELEKSINSCIDEKGNMMDSATSQLRSIRSSIRSYESNVRDKLDNYTKSQTKMLSDTIVTIRNDRYVLPVKQEYRGTIGGIVHDQSTSGSTLFMEPKAIVDLNNQIQEAQSKEKQEINRILQELSGQIAANEAVLTENISLLAQLDFINARAKLGSQMNGAMPDMNEKGIINLEEARHPLISEIEAVTNDVVIGEDYSTIVITGPNTGGKTVTLKMVGLLTLMAQAGLQLPAEDGCQMAVFDNVFADIGDEQSIEQSLSTFSSHMTNIVSILQQVDHKSLVLFDELGAGTDPQEGAALAMAILDDVVARGAITVATTHYPELKAYSYNRDNVVNASVEFNAETLEPTYRLLIGMPGRSNAFDIAKRLGLSDSIIDQAKSHVGVDAASVENMIASLEQSYHQAEADYERAHEILSESENLHNELQKAWNQFKTQRETLYKNAEEKAAKALQNARDEAETIVDEVRRMKTDAQLKEHEWIEAQKMLEEAQPDLSTKKSDKTASANSSQQELKPGDHIKLLSANQEGSVLEKVNNKEYMVQVGIMKVKVNRSDLEYIKDQSSEADKPLTTVKGSDYHVNTELDLRGERYEDAMDQLDKYVDDALLAGYPKVFIIHGKGTGALRKGVQQFAQKNPRIKGSRQGEAGEGGSGVTVLELT